MRYCHFGVSPVNYSDSDSDENRDVAVALPVRATKSGRDLPLERKSLLSKLGDRFFLAKLIHVQNRTEQNFIMKFNL